MATIRTGRLKAARGWWYVPSPGEGERAKGQFEITAQLDASGLLFADLTKNLPEVTVEVVVDAFREDAVQVRFFIYSIGDRWESVREAIRRRYGEVVVANRQGDDVVGAMPFPKSALLLHPVFQSLLPLEEDMANVFLTYSRGEAELVATIKPTVPVEAFARRFLELQQDRGILRTFALRPVGPQTLEALERHGAYRGRAS